MNAPHYGPVERSSGGSPFHSAELEDIRTLLRLSEALYAEDGLGPFDVPRAEWGFRQLIENPSLGHVWLVRVGDLDVGFMALTWGFSIERWGCVGLVDELYISPAHRGRGLGRAALVLAEEQCRAHGAGALQLEVSRGNQRAQNLYQRAGLVSLDRDLMTKLVRT